MDEPNDFYLPPRDKRRYIGKVDTINSVTDVLHKAGAVLNLDHLLDDQIQKLWIKGVIDVQTIADAAPVVNVVTLPPQDEPIVSEPLPAEETVKKKKRG